MKGIEGGLGELVAGGFWKIVQVLVIAEVQLYYYTIEWSLSDDDFGWIPQRRYIVDTYSSSTKAGLWGYKDIFY